MAYVSQLSKIVKSHDMETCVKAILYGPNGTGKTTSVLASAPKPILVIDAERRISIYKDVFEFEVFPSIEPDDILNLTIELAMLHKQGQPLPWKTVLIDSGTEYYRHVKRFALDKEREQQKNPNKTKLELNEWDAPKSMFYDAIDNLKRLPVHLYVTAHESANYIPGQIMRVDPLRPTRPNLEKNAEHHFDIVAHYEKKGSKYKVTFEKKCILNKQYQEVLPPVIDDVNNLEIVALIHRLIAEQKGYTDPKFSSKQSNVIRTNAKFETALDESLANVQTLQWSNDRIVSAFKEATGYVTPDELRNDANAESLITKFLDITRAELEAGAAAGGFDEV